MKSDVRGLRRANAGCNSSRSIKMMNPSSSRLIRVIIRDLDKTRNITSVSVSLGQKPEKPHFGGLRSMISSLRACLMLSESELSQHSPTLHGFVPNQRPPREKNTVSLRFSEKRLRAAVFSKLFSSEIVYKRTCVFQDEVRCFCQMKR